ncbi:MAG: CubicO group peptidase (beta-lactamase class C family) [Verrucomicrobiales bacterium]|jgi:CubicO group peptidase (beta-lactamase class C family)
MKRILSTCASLAVAGIFLSTVVRLPFNRGMAFHMVQAVRGGIFALLFFVTPCASIAEELVEESLEALLKKTVAEFDLPAMGAIAFRSNALLDRSVTGIRARGHEEKATLSDKWHIGSLTKSMTATLAATLVEEKMLTWETSLEDCLGSRFRIRKEYQAVTLRDLMRHRGGFPSKTTGSTWQELMRDDGSERQQRKRVLREVLQMEPETTPLTQVQYANLNFIVAGGMLEEVADSPWQELIKQRLFDPLGMSSAGFGVPASKKKSDQPWGHNADGTEVAPEAEGSDNPPVLGPAGTVHCSLNDLARYYSFHLRKGTAANGKRLLAVSAFTTLHGIDQDVDQWGLGWIKTDRSWAGGTALNHAGTNTMFYAVVWLAPARDFGVVVVTNQGGDKAAKATDAVTSVLVTRYGK